MIFKNFFQITKKILIPFIVILFLLFPDTFASSWETQTWTVFSWSVIFQDVNYDSLKNDLETEILSFDYNSIIWDYQTISYKKDLEDIKNILYQILILLFFVWFFHLMWLFYTFFNDILWKK